MYSPLYSLTPIDDLQGYPLSRRLLEAAIRISFAVLFAFCVMRLILPMTAPSTSAVADFSFAFGCLLFLALISWGRRNLLAGLGLLILLILLFLSSPHILRDLLPKLLREMVSAYLPSDPALPNEVPENRAVADEVLRFSQFLLRFFISFFSYLMIARFRMTLPLAGLLILLIPLSQKSPYPVAPIWLLPASLLLLLSAVWDSQFFYKLSARKKWKFSHSRAFLNLLQIAVPILLAAGIAFSLLPSLSYQSLYSPFLQGIVDDLSNSLPKSFNNDLKLSNFNLSGAGYYNSSGELGGPIELNDHEVFLVEGVREGLLAGTRYVNFDGRRWALTPTTDFYRFSSPFSQAQKEEKVVFRRERTGLSPKPELAALQKQHQYRITPLRNDQQSVLLLGTLEELTIPREAGRLFYYNATGNVYAGQPLLKDKSYGVRSESLPELTSSENSSPDTEKFADLLEQNAAAISEAARSAAPDEQEQEAKHYAETFFLELPPLPQYREGGLVFNLARDIGGQAEFPIQKVLALKNYLSGPEFRYTLQPRPLHSGEDLVDVLLQEKEGYCVYYASAFTMMARSLGIPARYVEGYRLPKEAQQRGNALIMTQRYAHAWSEVYLDGLGWIAVDPTPGNGERSNKDQNQQSRNSETTPPPSAPPPGAQSQTAPSSQTSPSLPPTSSRESLPPPPSDLWKHALFLFVLLPLLLLIFLLLLLRGKRELARSHDAALIRARTGENLLMQLAFYRQQLHLLLRFLPRGKDGETRDCSADEILPHEGFAEEARRCYDLYRAYLNEEQLKQLIQLSIRLECAFYSPHPLPEQSAEKAAALYDELENEVQKRLPSPLYLLRRVLFMPGIRGSLREAKKLEKKRRQER